MRKKKLGVLGWTALLVCLTAAATGLRAQSLAIYDDELYYQPSSDKAAHGAWTRITLSEVEDDPVDGDYLEFDHNASDSSSTPYAKIMFTSNGRLRRPSEFDSGMDLTAYNRLTFRARAPNLPGGTTYQVGVAMGIDLMGSQDTGNKSMAVDLTNQWQTFNIDLVALNPGGAGTLDSINCLFSLNFQKANGSVVVDFDDIRYYYDPAVGADLGLVYTNGFECDGLITQGDGVIVPTFEETTQNPAVPTPNATNKIKLVFAPSENPGGVTWVRKALTHLTYWKNNSSQIGRNLTGKTTLKFRAVAVIAGGGASYPVTIEMGKDFQPSPYDTAWKSEQIAILTNDWHEYSISMNNLNPPPIGGQANLSDINDLFNVLLYEANGPVTLYIDDIRYE